MMELWPFTNFHDMNLDWIISKWKKLEDNLDDIHASMDAAEGYADDAKGYMLDARSEKTQAAIFATQAGNKADDARSEKTQAAIFATQAGNKADDAAASAASIANVANQVEVNTSRIDSLIANAGDGTIPSELSDIRIGYNGFTYPTAGDAVREQIETIHNQAFVDQHYTLSNTTSGDRLIKWIGNTFIQKTTGALTSDPGPWYTSEKIRCAAGDRLLISLEIRFTTPAALAFYDAGDTLLSTLTSADGVAGGNNYYTFNHVQATAPVNTAYARVCRYTANWEIEFYLNAPSTRPSWIGKRWTIVGDSLSVAGHPATTLHYYDYIQNNTGIVPTVIAANGTGWAKTSGSGNAWHLRMNEVSTDANVITFFGSFNDLTSGLPIGQYDDSGTSTICGCINETLNNLYTQYPGAIVGIIAPTPWDTTRPNFNDQSNSYQYVEALKTIAIRNSLPFLDLWRESGLRPWSQAGRDVAYTKDGGSGTHPDEYGHYIIAAKIQAFLETLLN